MRFEWDQRKAAENFAKHRIAFERIEDFDFDTALSWVDHRFAYGELREVAIGFIGVVPHVAVYTVHCDEDEEVLRLISLRKASTQEMQRYADEIHG